MFHLIKVLSRRTTLVSTVHLVRIVNVNSFLDQRKNQSIRNLNTSELRKAKQLNPNWNRKRRRELRLNTLSKLMAEDSELKELSKALEPLRISVKEQGEFFYL